VVDVRWGRLRVDGRSVGERHRFGGHGPVSVAGTRYRGSVEVLRRGGSVLVVNEVPLEDYVAGTLLREMSPAFAEEALQAQAVVTRTYAMHQMRLHRGEAFHVGAGTDGVVYGGLDAESSLARRVTQSTRGEYLADDSGPILAAFHSASGGRTASSAEVWGRALPYLVSLPVPGEERSPEAAWRASFTDRSLGAALAHAGVRVGRVRAVRVLSRTESGRAGTVRVSGDARDVELTGRKLRDALGRERLRSTRFEVRNEAGRITFSGSGYGHGVGLSQWGAHALAARGAGYRDILARFYPGTRLRGPLPELVTSAGGGG
jgi:stage II sporulation protein D